MTLRIIFRTLSSTALGFGNGEQDDLRDDGGKGDGGRETRSTPSSDRSIERAQAFVSRHVAAERRKMAKRKGSSVPSCSRARKKVDRDAREVENARRLDKLPQEVWEKILDELDENDLFPLALSCRYFRQKQKELVARTRQSGSESGKPRLSLKTNLEQKRRWGEPASAEYLRFARKEKVSRDVAQKKAKCIRFLAAYHSHLPLLQELLKPLKKLDPGITNLAGESPSSQTLHRLLLLRFGF